MLHNSSPQSSSSAPWTLDADSRTIRTPSGVARLTHREIDLLQYFETRLGQLVSIEDLLKNIWGITPEPGSLIPPAQAHQVHRAILRLRAKIEMNVTSPQILVTAYGVGYIVPLSGAAPESEPHQRSSP